MFGDQMKNRRIAPAPTIWSPGGKIAWERNYRVKRPSAQSVTTTKPESKSRKKTLCRIYEGGREEKTDRAKER